MSNPDKDSFDMKDLDSLLPAAAAAKGVPDFWLKALKTNQILAEKITKRDEEALKYLKDVKWCEIDNPNGFKLEFFFDANPFFKNSVLTKTYHMIDDDDDDDEPILEKAIGTEIEWHPGKCSTPDVLKKNPKKGSSNMKPIMKTEKCESFFNFFKPPEVPENDDDIDEDMAKDLHNMMEEDYNIATTIRDEIIPHAVSNSRFTGEQENSMKKSSRTKLFRTTIGGAASWFTREDGVGINRRGVVSGVSDAASKASHAFDKIGDAVGHAFDKIGDAVGHAFDKIGDAVGDYT